MHRSSLPHSTSKMNEALASGENRREEGDILQNHVLKVFDLP